MLTGPLGQTRNQTSCLVKRKCEITVRDLGLFWSDQKEKNK